MAPPGKQSFANPMMLDSDDEEAEKAVNPMLRDANPVEIST